VESTRPSRPRRHVKPPAWHRLAELARQRGVLSRPEVRRQALWEGDEALLRPLLPPRAGHLALLLASGALTGLVVTDQRGHRLLLRGSTARRELLRYEDDEERFDETFVVHIDALDLDNGQRLALYGDGASPDQIASFLFSARESLAQAAARALRPLIDRISPEELEQLPPLLRPPLGMQGPAVVALARALKNGRRALVVGEQGCGKTYISLAAAYAAGCRCLLVLCPPHLARKWAREVRLTIPGAAAIICHRPSDLERARSLARSGRPVVCIVTREVAKLHFQRAPAAVLRLAISQSVFRRAFLRRTATGAPARVPACPRCFSSLQRDWKTGQLPARCPSCGEVLLAARAGRGPRRYALARYIARRMGGVFDCLIIDEAHEYRSADSLQAAAALTLATTIPRAICLTGTLLGGYASHLYNILLIVSPAFRERYSPRQGGRSRFAREFGLRSRRRRLHDDRISYHPRPGVSPTVAPWLLEKGVYLRLDEVVQLPPLQEEALLVEPSPDLRRAILQLHRRARERLEASPFLARATAAIMHSLLSFPDLAWAGEEVMDPTSGELLLRAAPLGEGPLPKEEALISLVREEIARGRPCLVYVTYTGTRDITARLVNLLQEAGIVAEALRAEAVPPARREAWLLSRMAAGIQALVCQPRLVALGLDLVHFPTVVFFQPDPDPFVVRQAARRSYRIGQSRPVRVVYMAYRESAQELLLSLLAKKAAASLLLEGEALGGGLLHLSEEETLRELARLVREGGAEDAREALRAAAEASAWAGARPGWEGIAPSPATVLSSMGLQLALPGL
jgi:hypothetical protein